MWEKITLIAKTDPAVAAAAEAKLEEGFSFNKDVKLLQCPVGELAMWVEKQEAKNGNQPELRIQLPRYWGIPRQKQLESMMFL